MSTKGIPLGWTALGFKPVLSAFRDGFAKGIDKGASLSIYYKGNLVVNVWGGFADEPIKRVWKEDTYGHFWSGTKYLSSIVIAHLVERGHLAYEEKISKYWPEFAQNGKESITLDSLLSHSAGLSISKENYQMMWMREKPHLLSEFLASQTPIWKPGTKHGYSGFLFALYLNEIVKRVDVKERTLSQYFNDEIAEPFGLDLHIGLPKSLYHRANRSFWRKISEEEIMKEMENFQGDWDLFMLGKNQPSDLNLKTSIDDPDFASLGCGSSHGVGTAKVAAEFAGIVGNGGQRDGKVMLTQKSIEKLQIPLTYGIDCVLSQTATWGRGNMIYPASQGDKSWFLIGHLGYGGQAIITDPQYKMGFAYITNYMEPYAGFSNNRWRHLLDTFYQCVGQLEGITGSVKLYDTYEDFLKNAKKTEINSKL